MIRKKHQVIVLEVMCTKDSPRLHKYQVFADNEYLHISSENFVIRVLVQAVLAQLI